MARIAGVNIPTNKRVEIALTYIHGIGRTKAKEITGKLTEVRSELRRERLNLARQPILHQDLEQDRVVDSVCRLFPEASVVDRRATPSYGYRAVHVIASVGGRLVEIQIRSRLQHLWAELSEKFSDVVDPAIKYGGGRENIRELLTASSIMVQEYERVEKT